MRDIGGSDFGLDLASFIPSSIVMSCKPLRNFACIASCLILCAFSRTKAFAISGHRYSMANIHPAQLHLEVLLDAMMSA